jgi:outer membrane protein assembly factor BamB
MLISTLLLSLAVQSDLVGEWILSGTNLQRVGGTGPELGVVSPLQLPAKDLGVEVVCAPDSPGQWSAVLSSVEDNGSYERGWVLGSHGDHFFFGVVGAETNQIHYIQGRTRFEEGTWHQVVGTYDGEVQRLYVDGVLDTEARVTSGPISYADTHTFAIGSYVDADERHDFVGSIHSVRLWDRVPKQEDFAGRWRAVQPGLPARTVGFPEETLEGWPTFGGDVRRSNATAQELSGKPRLIWTHTPLSKPSPSWGDPADGSHWQKLESMAARVVHDRAFFPVSRAGRVFYASSSDDGVHALDAASGEPLWRFYTEGPVRLAPFVGEDRVWFGSDDGQVYCLDVESGALIWRRSLAPEQRRIPSNGKLISPWPVRTGVAVANGVLYATAGLFPEQGCFAFALDAERGEILWKQTLDKSVSPQGYLLLSPTRLYVPSGRATPFALDREDGAWHGQFGGPGGTWALLTDTELITGPDDKGQLAVASRTGLDQLASFQGKHLVVSGGNSYLQTNAVLIAMDRERRKALSAEREALAGSRLTAPAGASDAECRKIEQKGEMLDKALEKIDRLMAACMTWSVSEELSSATIVVGDQIVVGGSGLVRGRDVDTGKERWRAKVPGAVQGLAFADGRLFVALDGGALCCLAPEASTGPVDPIKRQSPSTEFTLPEEVHGRRGYALVIEPTRCDAIAKVLESTELNVAVLVRTWDEADKIRKQVHERERLQVLVNDGLPFTDHCMEVVIHEGPDGQAEIDRYRRLLRPGSGVALVGSEQLTRPALEGAGTWSHALADAGNSASSMDRHVSDDLQLQWFGGPGPAGVVDRHLRSAPPLCVDGILVIQGQDQLRAVDAYHGTLLWTRSFEGLSRMAVSLDSGYQAADAGELWLAQANVLRCVDLRTGLDLREVRAPVRMEFGWLALDKERVLVSIQPEGTSRREQSYGEVDLQFKDEQPLICSQMLIAYDRDFVRRLWKREFRCVPNSSLALSGGRVFGVEAREAAGSGRVLPATVGQAGPTLFALDVERGRPIFDLALDLADMRHALFVSVRDDTLVVTTSHTFSDDVSGFYLQVRNASDGALRWTAHTPNNGAGSSHGEQVHHPVLLENVLVAEPRAYDLASGAILSDGKWWMPKRRGCGTLSASADTLYFRDHNPRARKIDGPTVHVTSVSRPGCWINILPAAGLVLLPEASAGCVCSFPVQTSMAFLPR